MFTVIIPARYASTRLPGKPLAMIAGKPMVQHVVERAQQSLANRVIVATDDKRISEVVDAFGGEVCMTSAHHVSGTDRLQEVVSKNALGPDEIVVNVQGDEPLIPSAVINQVAENLRQYSRAAAATLSEPILHKEDYANPNIVKVVSDSQGYALYFSRATIPFARDGIDLLFSQNGALEGNALSWPQRHIGIYAYRVGLLNQFVTWPVAPLEAIESLEQLRILFNGEAIHVAEASELVPGGIDTAEDLAKLQDQLKEPPINLE